MNSRVRGRDGEDAARPPTILADMREAWGRRLDGVRH